MKKCPYCTKEIQDEAVICRHCRAKLKNSNLKYLYEECKDAFLDEWRRKESLNSTARTYLTIYTIVLGVGFIKIDAVINLLCDMVYKWPIMSRIFSFVYVFFLCCSFLTLWMTLKAIQLEGYRTFPEPNKLRDAMKDKSLTSYFKSLAKDFAKSTIHNEKQNNKKGDFLIISYVCINASILCAALIFVGIVVFKIINGG